MTDEKRLSVRVVESLADAKGIDPDDLELELARYVDLGALDDLYRHDGDSWCITFETCEHRVTVAGDGSVAVTDRES